MLIYDLKEAVTDPRYNPALMTFEEYVKFANKEGKSHPDTAYNWTVEEMNRYSIGGSFRRIDMGYDNFIEIFDDGPNIVLKRDGDIIGFSDHNTLYIQKFEMSRALKYLRGQIDLEQYDIRYIKYPNKAYYKKHVKEKYKKYQTTINQVKLKGEKFVIKKDANGSYAVFNDQLEEVGVAQDEWGATLVAVAKEYRGYGIGKILAKLWTEENPHYTTGGVTPSGNRTLRKLWETFVREALQNGDYRKWIKNGLINIQKVKEITNSIGPRKRNSSTPKQITNLNDTSKWLVFHDDTAGFIIYHRDLLNYEIDITNDGMEKYILGYSFLRYFEPRDEWFFYRIDYDNEKAERLLLILSLQYLYDNEDNHPLSFNTEAADYSESITKLPNTIIDNETIKLAKPIINIHDFSRLEKIVRGKIDPYQQKRHALIELAEQKYS